MYIKEESNKTVTNGPYTVQTNGSFWAKIIYTFSI